MSEPLDNRILADTSTPEQEAQWTRGSNLWVEGKYAAAIEVLKKLIPEVPARDFTLLGTSYGYMADSYAELGKLGEAVKNFSLAVQCFEHNKKNPSYVQYKKRLDDLLAGNSELAKKIVK